MPRPKDSATTEVILQVVVELLESEGHDAVQMRTVAKRARVSLGTLYDRFSTRDQLIVEALIQWMTEHGFQSGEEPGPDASVHEAMMWGVRRVLEPWEDHPHLLLAYRVARTGPEGHRLEKLRSTVIDPVGHVALAKLEPEYAEDLRRTLYTLVVGALTRVSEGTLASGDAAALLDRALRRLTGDNAALAAGDTSTGS